MILLNLFLGFLQVGCFAFGGAYGAIPLIREVVLTYGWLDDELLTYMIAVSESTPGPIMVNLATYVGASQAGICGAVIATLAVVLPSFFIILLITATLSKAIKNKYVQAVLRGVKPCMVGMILATGCWMIVRNMYSESFAELNIKAVFITIILLGLNFGSGKIVKKGISPIMLIVTAAILGVTIYGI